MGDNNSSDKKKIIQDIWNSNGSKASLDEALLDPGSAKPCRAANHLDFTAFGDNPTSAWKELLIKEGKFTEIQ